MQDSGVSDRSSYDALLNKVKELEQQLQDRDNRQAQMQTQIQELQHKITTLETNREKELSNLRAELVLQHQQELMKKQEQLDAENAHWKQRLKAEIKLREESQQAQIRLEEKLNEAGIRIEEWKYHFLMETQERENEKKQLMDTVSELTKQLNMLKNNSKNKSDVT